LSEKAEPLIRAIDSPKTTQKKLDLFIRYLKWKLINGFAFI